MKAITIFVFLLLAVHTRAAIWYVATTGSDANPGTSELPFLRVAAALSAAQAGDTIQIAAGDYPSTFSTVRNGTALAPITIQGTGSTTTRNINFYHDYIVVRNLQSIGGWYFYKDSNNCLVEDATSDLQLSTEGGNVWMEPVSPTDHARCHSHTVRNCQILNAKTTNKQAVQLNGTGHLIENCYLAKTANSADCFWIWGHNHTIRGCTVQNWDQVPYDPVIHLDIFQTFSTHGSPSKNILIENNFFNGGTNTQLGHIEDQAQNESISDWTFRNNIFANITNGQFTIYAPRFKFYNNIFYKCATMNGKYAIPTFRTSSDRGRGHGGVMRNNIWYLCGQNTATSYHGFYDLHDSDPGGGLLNDMDIDYNMVIGTGSGTVKNGKWTSYRSIARNVNGLNGVDPLFVNPINADTLDELRFEPESPAIGAAQVLNELFTTDYSGVTRGAAWDMGALEYDVGELPTDTTAPTLTTAIIDSTGALLTLTCSENVFGVSEAHYTLSGGHSLGSVEVIGPVVTMTVTPPVVGGEVVTLSYTSGASRTADAAGNLLASFSITSGTPGFDNDSLETTPDPPRPAGRGAAARRVLR